VFLLQRLQQKLDDYFAQHGESDSYDSVDAAFELAAKLSDDELHQIIQEANLWTVLLGEQLTTSGRSDRVRSLRDVVVEVVAAELLM